MKTRIWITVVLLALFFSGCVVYSFYPLYTKDDLFPNNILTGNWMDDDSTIWQFEHAIIKGEKAPGNIDSASYTLVLKENTTGKEDKNEFSVHIIKIEQHYFLDFYLADYLHQGVGDDLASFHIVPVHTFAKLTIEENKLVINWFDQNWLEDLIKENRIRIHHENNGDYILLTAKPHELQKFVTKYVNSEEAFKDGLEVILTRE